MYLFGQLVRFFVRCSILLLVSLPNGQSTSKFVVSSFKVCLLVSSSVLNRLAIRESMSLR